MKKVILEFDQCQYTGMPGLFLQGVDKARVNAAHSGTLIAHDLLEHDGVNTIGGLCHELEAMGALWYIRGSLHDVYRGNSSYYNSYELVELEISSLIKQMARASGLDLPIPKTRACIYDQDFIDIIKKARKQTLRHHGILQYERSLMLYCFDHCIHYMRNGYRKAKRRFRRMNQSRVNSLFWNIVQEVDLSIKHMEYEGDRIQLRYCLTTGHAIANLIEPD